jgi:predicted MPP superfamily phosphohydrolase
MVLENSGLLLQIGSHPIFLAGLESAWAGHPNINLALSRRREGDPVILMMHEPDFADTAAAAGRIALQLSGHSHGGQVRVPLVGAIRLPSWGRKYDQGLYKLDGMRVYTNRGIGMVKHPVRFNCPPEVTVMTLVRESVVL